MGTQFWWFYDVLILAVAAGLLYNAVVKGFNKMVFHLVGFVLAFVAGFFGSSYLAEPAYDMLYPEQVTANFRAEYEAVDFYELTAQDLLQHPQDGAPDQIDSGILRETAEEIAAGGEIPQWFCNAVGNTANTSLGTKLAPKPTQTIGEAFAEDEMFFRAFLEAQLSGDASAAASCLENYYVRPYYLDMVGMALFLLLELVVLIIVGIIAGMAGNMEQQMHIRRFNRALAVPVGLIEVASMLLSIVIAVKLVVMASDNMMLLFNLETIEETILFRLLYERI